MKNQKPCPSRALADTLLAAPYVWPGGYALQARMEDGEILCHSCVQSELREVTDPIPGSGWTIIALEVLWEGPPELCAHCGREIPTEYGDPEE